MKLIIGLGNPGDRYINNRRNIGFKVIDVFANNTNIKIRAKKKKSLLGMGDFEGHEIVLLKPQTFIDLSGEAVLYIASFLRIPVKKIIVIHDDYKLKFGKIQVAVGRCETVNIGVESIAVGLKSHKFVRIRVGIGPISVASSGHIISSPTEKDIKDFVMENFSLDQNLKIIEIINDTEAALRSILTQNIEDVLSRYKIGPTL